MNKSREVLDQEYVKKREMVNLSWKQSHQDFEMDEREQVATRLVHWAIDQI
jgi:hypothetical protein